MASASVYSDDPPAMAKHWCELGARRLHVVDLDGAFAGEPVNQRLVEQHRRSRRRSARPDRRGHPQHRDGTRLHRDWSVASDRWHPGHGRPRFPTRALADEFPGRAILGLDAKDGRAATRGWTTTSGVDVLSFADSIRELDLFAIVYTDVARDGMLSGVNATATRQLAEVAGTPVIASGGVKNLDDLRALKALDLDPSRLLGAISGSALYEGTLDFTRGSAACSTPTRRVALRRRDRYAGLPARTCHAKGRIADGDVRAPLEHHNAETVLNADAPSANGFGSGVGGGRRWSQRSGMRPSEGRVAKLQTGTPARKIATAALGGATSAWGAAATPMTAAAMLAASSRFFISFSSGGLMKSGGDDRHRGTAFGAAEPMSYTKTGDSPSRYGDPNALNRL